MWSLSKETRKEPAEEGRQEGCPQLAKRDCIHTQSCAGILNEMSQAKQEGLTGQEEDSPHPAYDHRDQQRYQRAVMMNKSPAGHVRRHQRDANHEQVEAR